MIRLGLSAMFSPRPADLKSDPSLAELQQSLSPEILRAVSETAAWVSSQPRLGGLRTPELDPSAILKLSAYKALGIDRWLKLKRESYQKAIISINQARSTLLRDRNISIDDATPSKGRLLVYEVLESVADGASEASSRGFFDIDRLPPELSEFDMHFFLKLIPCRPTFAQDMSPEERAVMQQHVAFWGGLMKQGKVVVFGPVMDPAGAYGVGIVSVESEDELREIIANDPAATINRYESYRMRAVVPQ